MKSRFQLISRAIHFTSKPLHGVLLALGIMCGVILVLPSAHASALASSNYTNYLIDNSVFMNSDSMGVGSGGALNIQAFLDNEGSGLASFSAVEDCGSTSGAHYTYYAQFYACGHTASAAQIIYAASQAYGINPQVILATLQKEQGLVTTPDPTASQLNCAMGYTSCASDSGFFYQVDNAAWQYKMDMETGQGNSYWGYSASSYPCSNATSLYNNGLKAGNNVTFSDSNGTSYANITLATMATATLYCYTPYVYNNPDGLYGNPQYGTTGLYYSGSYNFVNSFVTWWGTTYAPAYQATYYGQTAYPTIIRGNSTPSTLLYTNTGNQPWYDDVSASQYGADPVHLATSNPINTGSIFSAFWPTQNRATTTFAAVYDSDGVTLAPNQHIVQPGEIAAFNFSFSVPPNMTPGSYTQYFQPVLEGSSAWNMGGLAWFNVTVQARVYQATYYGQTAYPTIIRGNSTPSTLLYTNTGNQPWYDDVSASQYGADPVHLATSNPINTGSIFSAFWPTQNRATTTFAAVYDSDGVTLAPNQHIVQPGEIAAFNFSFSVPPNMTPGSYTQYFQPVLEGSSAWNMGGLAWSIVTVH